ncbi:unnamed protein product [Dovyalis caffra]|uniref:Ricin B lectin domain-containing protein n=1 Tax=Dovyalis caffra TaxID=77055 RepID=A0AAV1RX24_9ROSI|nr:unnamed protein product [Dovyalis caffra]
MKVWILQLMAVLLWVALHHHFMANAHDIYPHPEPKPIIEPNATDEDWKVNFTQAKSLVITGLNGLCLEVYRFAPKLVTCNESASKQRWQFRTDGTIRPETDPLKCLTANELKIRGIVVVVQCSDSSSAYTVWQYRNTDRAIVNAASNLVLDVSDSRVTSDSAQVFIIFTSRGSANQKWYTEPLKLQLSML